MPLKETPWPAGLPATAFAVITAGSVGNTGGRGVPAELIAVRIAWQVMSFAAAAVLQYAICAAVTPLKFGVP